MQPGAGRTALGWAGRSIVLTGTTRSVVVSGCPTVVTNPVGPRSALCRHAVATARAVLSAGEESQSLRFHGRRTTVVAQ